MTEDEIKAAGFRVGTVAEYLGLTPEEENEVEIRVRLGRIFKPEAVSPWLETPNPAFGGAKPSSDLGMVWSMIHEFETGSAF